VYATLCANVAHLHAPRACEPKKAIKNKKEQTCTRVYATLCANAAHLHAPQAYEHIKIEKFKKRKNVHVYTTLCANAENLHAPPAYEIKIKIQKENMYTCVCNAVCKHGTFLCTSSLQKKGKIVQERT